LGGTAQIGMTRKFTERVRSRARLGADQARVWARELTLGNPHAKSVLLAVANYMNEDGAAWPGMSTIARDTDLSEDTVANRLNWLEGIGAIAMFKCWVDENGRRNPDGRGRPTSSEIRFMFDSDPDAIEAAATDGKKPHSVRGAAAKSHAAKSEVSDRQQRGQNSTHLQGVSPGVAPDQPPPAADRIVESQPEDSPPYPPPGGEGPSVEGWEEFKTAFEADGLPILKVSLAVTLFAAMTPDERALGTKAAKGLIAIRAGQKKPGPKPAAQIFLREKEAHASFAKQAPPEPVKRATYAKGSKEYQALSVYSLIIRRGVLESESCDAPEALAQRPDMLALAEIPIDRSQWLGLSEENPDHRAMLGAWRERIKDWSGKWMQLEDLQVLDEHGQQVVHVKEWNGQELKFKQTYKGLAVPRRWPPRIDGTWPENENFAQAG
jgi:hypothetical protein